MEVTGMAEVRPMDPAVGWELYQARNSRWTDAGGQELSPALPPMLWGTSPFASLWASVSPPINEEVGPITGFQTLNFLNSRIRYSVEADT